MAFCGQHRRALKEKAAVIILITYVGELRGQREVFVSHGVCSDTLKNIPLPQEPLYHYVREGAYRCPDIGEYVMED